VKAKFEELAPQEYCRTYMYDFAQNWFQQLDTDGDGRLTSLDEPCAWPDRAKEAMSGCELFRSSEDGTCSFAHGTVSPFDFELCAHRFYIGRAPDPCPNVDFAPCKPEVYTLPGGQMPSGTAPRVVDHTTQQVQTETVGHSLP